MLCQTLSETKSMPRRTLGLLFLASFGLNLVFLLLQFLPSHKLLLFSGEEPRIAWSIATGNGFSSPFWKLTGPTAWSPPLQPYLMAGVFRAWGISTASALLARMVNIIFVAATAVVLSLLGAAVFGRRIGTIAGWAWVFLPPFIGLLDPFFGNLPYRETWSLLWDTSLATLLLSLLLLATVTIGAKRKLNTYGLYGALWGFSRLANPAVLSVLPACLYFVAEPRAGSRRRAIGRVAAVAAGFLLISSPWLIRNYVVFRHPIFIRSNFGVELHVGNLPGSNGVWESANEPAFNEVEWRRLSAVGEVQYAHDRLREAIQTINQHPGRFVSLSILRARHFWFGPPVASSRLPQLAMVKHFPFAAASLLAFAGVGLMIRRRIRFGWLFAWLLILYPLIYYVTFFLQRFRDLIDPELLLLAVFFIYSVFRGSGRVSEQELQESVRV